MERFNFSGLECGILHAQRIKDTLFQEHFPLFAGDNFNDGSADVDTGVGVKGSGAGLKTQGLCSSFTGSLSQRKSVPTLFALGGDLKGEAAGVVHDHTDGQGVFSRNSFDFALLALDCHLEIFELRKILGNGIVKRKFSLFHKNGNGHTAESLGLGALHIGAVQSDGAFFGRIGIAHAGGFLQVAFAENTDGSGECA